MTMTAGDVERGRVVSRSSTSGRQETRISTHIHARNPSTKGVTIPTIKVLLVQDIALSHMAGWLVFSTMHMYQFCKLI
jgi:hypothetical protein